MDSHRRGHTRSAYMRAVKEALYGAGKRMHSPAVKYAKARGFFVESDLIPNSKWTVTVWRANLSANTLKPYNLPDYSDLDLE